MSLLGDAAEQIRCRAGYAPVGDSQLHLGLVCASASFKMQVASDIVRSGNTLSGSWHEATFGASGGISGSITGDRIDAVVNGMGTSARLSLALRGRTQAVTLASQGALSGTASVVLRRQ